MLAREIKRQKTAESAHIILSDVGKPNFMSELYCTAFV